VNWKRIPLLLTLYAVVPVAGFIACASCGEKRNEISAEKKNKDPFSVIMAESLPV
jgi:hypothetical protein